MKKNRIAAVVLAICLLLACASGCSSSTESTKAISTGGEKSAGEPVATTAAEETTTEATTEAAKTPTIEETIVYDKGGIKITAKEYETDSFWGDGVKFLIENDTKKNITVGCDALIVNDYMISDLFVASVAAETKTNETMHLSSSQLKAAGIDVIGKIEVYFRIYDSDTFKNIAKPDCITIKTSLYDQMDTKADDSGEVLYDKGGIKIIGKYVDENSFWGKAILLYIENSSTKNVTIQADNLSINGFSFNSALFSSTVYAGKKAYSSIDLLSTELEKNSIESVEEVALKFKILDAKSFKSIAKSDLIKFKTK